MSLFSMHTINMYPNNLQKVFIYSKPITKSIFSKGTLMSTGSRYYDVDTRLYNSQRVNSLENVKSTFNDIQIVSGDNRFSSMTNISERFQYGREDFVDPEQMEKLYSLGKMDGVYIPSSIITIEGLNKRLANVNVGVEVNLSGDMPNFSSEKSEEALIFLRKTIDLIKKLEGNDVAYKYLFTTPSAKNSEPIFGILNNHGNPIVNLYGDAVSIKKEDKREENEAKFAEDAKAMHTSCGNLMLHCGKQVGFEVPNITDQITSIEELEELYADFQKQGSRK